MSSTKRAWKLQEFVAHGSNVNCLALGHKSGRVMVTGGEDKKVNMWAVGKPNCILSLSGHTSPVEAVRFGNAEEMVVAGSLSGALKIWDLEQAKIVRTLTGHKAGIRSLDFHPYGEFVASGSKDTNIKLWDIRRKGCIFTYKGHTGTVNSLRFSPDGRWISSASDDGLLKIWDLAAGKLLNDFRHHTGPVTTMEFHPNEFLIASGSSDKTVKFWDLESFNLVSSTDGDSTPVKCIFFHPEGKCLYSGSQDILKVYGWEPASCYDSLPMGWGKVADIAIAQNQLIGATFSQTNVSTFVVDVNRVQPCGGVATSQPAPVSAGSSGHHRRSFVDRPTTQSTRQVPRTPKEEPPEEAASAVTGAGDSDDKEEDNMADIKDPSDFKEVFQGRHKLARSPTRKDEPFPAPPDDGMPTPTVVKSANRSPVGPRTTARTSPSRKADSTQSKRPDSGESKKPNSNTRKPDSAPSRKPESTPSRKPDSAPSRKPDSAPSRKPESAQNKKPDNDAQQKPERESRRESPARRDKRQVDMGLNPEDFLPRQAVPSISRGSLPADMSETEALSSIVKGHDSMAAVMSSRSKNLQIVRALWTGGNTKTAVDSAIGMNDSAIVVDLLNILITKPALWNLDMCSTMVPQISTLVSSKYDNYVNCALTALRLVLKNFASVIKSNIAAPPSVGVDISREERYHKCKACYKHLMDIRSEVSTKSPPANQAALFREINLMMSQLD